MTPECRVQDDRAFAVFIAWQVGGGSARRMGAVGVLILAEGPMEWDVVRVLASKEIAIMVASSSQRQLETIRKAGLVAIEVEPTKSCDLRTNQPGPRLRRGCQ